MKNPLNKKIYYYVDESGDPVFFNRKGKDLVKSGDSSPVFIVGYLEAEEPKSISKAINTLREDVSTDEYLKDIPSLKNSIVHFHAKDDCAEVREKVFKAIKSLDLKAYIIVARKNSDQFRTKFKGRASNLYEYLVEKLFENRLHLYSEIDIYFSKMGNIVREKNMLSALDKAKETFYNKWGKTNESSIRLFIQEPSQIVPLQVIDYILWAVNRVYSKGDMRYFNYIRDKVSLVIDIFDSAKYPNIYYSEKKPLDITKISPLNS